MRGRSGSRAIAAAAPGPGLQALQDAYLGLLKLCLCDLAGAGTTSVEGRPGGGVAARELAPGELELRVRGEDWPLRGLTMGGLLRLDDLQRCVETVVEDSIPGDMIEVGTWRGGSSILMRATLDVLGDEDRTVWVADSFQGFPAPVPEAGEAAASEAYPDTVEPYLAAFDFLAVPAQEVRRSFERFGLDHGVELIEGFFEDTLPGLGERRWSLVRLDADTYDSTVLALSSLYDGLEGGGYLVVDDYGALEECRAAVDRFRAGRGIEASIEWVDDICVRWRKRADEPVRASAPADLPRREIPRNRPMPRAPRGPVPAVRELELAAELAGARAELNDLRAELERAHDTERRLAEVMASSSWRLTRPLRELGRMLRRR